MYIWHWGEKMTAQHLLRDCPVYDMQKRCRWSSPAPIQANLRGDVDSLRQAGLFWDTQFDVWESSKKNGRQTMKLSTLLQQQVIIHQLLRRRSATIHFTLQGCTTKSSFTTTHWRFLLIKQRNLHYMCNVIIPSTADKNTYVFSQCCMIYLSN